MPLCPACKVSIPEDSRFCGFCGFKLSPISPEAHRKLSETLPPLVEDAIPLTRVKRSPSEERRKAGIKPRLEIVEGSGLARALSALSASAPAAPSSTEGTGPKLQVVDPPPGAPKLQVMDPPSSGPRLDVVEGMPAAAKSSVAYLDTVPEPPAPDEVTERMELPPVSPPPGEPPALMATAPLWNLPAQPLSRLALEVPERELPVAPPGPAADALADTVPPIAPLPAVVPAHAPDTRRFPRFPLKVEVSYSSEHNFFTGFMENIGEGGLFVATHTPISLGDMLEVTFTVPGLDHVCTALCRVRWVREYNPTSPDSIPGMGLQFTKLAPDERAAIELFIKHREPIFYDD